MPRRTLSALALSALAGTALLVPTTASAVTDADLTWTVRDATVTMTSATVGSLVFDYSCGSVGSPFHAEFNPGVFQPTYPDPRAEAHSATPEDRPTLDCNGVVNSLDWNFAASKGTFVNGPARVGAYYDINDTPKFEDVTVTGAPAAQLAPVALTLDAGPEPARKGKQITVKGTAERDGKAYKKVKVALEFQPEGGSFARVRSVTADKKGKLKTTVKATRSGTYRFTLNATDTTQAGRSEGDHVDVIPVAKKYKNCAALNEVYPQGVGKKGATDKGGDVTDFTVDNATYAKNKKSDRDKDGIACEQ